MTDTPYVHQPVPRVWPGATVVCLATGPSLTQADVDYCRGRARVIAIKQAVTLAPWADALYACDAKYWQHDGDRVAFAGLKYALDPGAAKWASVLRHTGEMGLEADPTGLKTGRNSGAQAIGLAVHLGAARIVLLGYDQQPGPDGRDHFFGAHPWNKHPTYVFPTFFQLLVAPLKALGIRIINATRRTALVCFERLSLEEALA